MATNTNEEEQVLTLLCGDADPWTWGDANQCSLSFERNGTGAILCGENQRVWIAVEFNWSFNNQARPVMANSDTWKFTIQMTLTTRLNPIYHTRNPWLTGEALQDHLRNPPPPSKAPFPWAPLHSAAFRPKQYTLMLSRGRFIEPFHCFVKQPFPIFQPYRYAPNRYACRLAFDDSSPYPPREEWVETSGLKLSLDYHHFWERREFVREAIAKKDETWAETLDLGWWLSPTSGDGHIRNK
ncbi:hypothetical protein CC80DRAFT_490098 [Byssothecium circinans]|uniref:Uncharacterized protein n=1 Tax=Byssothecium circinans TaxID=147558 RepID=A0A6A5U1T8_9PLEO|nr:hypothetical protein CC80DRAFT_490098 [Byssothecium circinans]